MTRYMELTGAENFEALKALMLESLSRHIKAEPKYIHGYKGWFRNPKFPKLAAPELGKLPQ